jgi:hypothetical protein
MNKNRLVFACLAGCLMASLLGLLLAFACGSPLPAIAAATVLPVASCYFAGLRSSPLLAKIAAYAAVGWCATFVLAPSVDGVVNWERSANSPLVGYEWYIPCSVVSSLLAVVGVAFIRCEDKARR